MAKIRLTKNELKKQKDSLKRFNRYLPTLFLKKKQLQVEIRKVDENIREKSTARKILLDEVIKWIGVFGQDAGLDVGLEELIKKREIQIATGNIAGVDIPIFEGIDFEDVEYNLFTMSLWVDSALEIMKKLLSLHTNISILEKQKSLLGEELRITTQRVNLFEKVKIPQAGENIRIILVFLGDQQTAAVVRGKISKNKLVRVS